MGLDLIILGPQKKENEILERNFEIDLYFSSESKSENHLITALKKKGTRVISLTIIPEPKYFSCYGEIFFKIGLDSHFW